MNVLEQVEAELNEGIVALDAVKDSDFIEAIEALREARADAAKAKARADKLRAIVAAGINERDAEKVSLSGKVIATLTEVSRNEYDWDMLRRLAPKAVLKATMRRTSERINTY